MSISRLGVRVAVCQHRLPRVIRIGNTPMGGFGADPSQGARMMLRFGRWALYRLSESRPYVASTVSPLDSVRCLLNLVVETKDVDCTGDPQLDLESPYQLLLVKSEVLIRSYRHIQDDYRQIQHVTERPRAQQRDNHHPMATHHTHQKSVSGRRSGFHFERASGPSGRRRRSWLCP